MHARHRQTQQRTTNPIHKVSRLLLGGDAHSVSAAPASASLHQPSENEAVLKAFNQEVLVVKNGGGMRGWGTFCFPSDNLSHRAFAVSFRPVRRVASCGYQVQQRLGSL